MAFKLKSGNKVNFKSMGSSPARNMKDDPSNNPMNTDTNMYSSANVEANTDSAANVENVENETQGASAGNTENAVVRAPDPVEKTLSEGLVDAKENTEEEKLQEQSKKEMYANAWQNSGVGHMVEAVKSIRRGIKKNKAKKSAKNAVKLADAKTAVESGTETYKQAKRVDKAKSKANKKEDREWKKEDKSDKRLAKYNAKKDDKAAKGKVKVEKMKVKIDKERNS